MSLSDFWDTGFRKETQRNAKI